MNRRLVVTGNCQTTGFAAALRLALPDDLVVELPIRVNRSGSEDAEHVLADADAWIAMPAVANAELERFVRPGVLRVPWPKVSFNGFHPDLVYATRGSELVYALSDYHSAIGLWAWKKGLEPGEAASLFTAEAFDALGYHGFYLSAQERLGKQVEAAALDWGRFWLAAKRLGVFMHTMNHPGIDILALVAKHVALRLGAAREVLAEPLGRYLEDALITSTVWPVYPAVAQYLGVAGSYRFTVQGHHYPSLEAFLTAQWEAYVGTDPEEVDCLRFDDGRYEAVLSPLVRARA